MRLKHQFIPVKAPGESKKASALPKLVGPFCSLSYGRRSWRSKTKKTQRQRTSGRMRRFHSQVFLARLRRSSSTLLPSTRGGCSSCFPAGGFSSLAPDHLSQAAGCAPGWGSHRRGSVRCSLSAKQQLRGSRPSGWRGFSDERSGSTATLEKIHWIAGRP